MKRGREESYASSAIPCYVEIRVDRVERDKFFLVISCMEQKLFWKSIYSNWNIFWQRNFSYFSESESIWNKENGGGGGGKCFPRMHFWFLPIFVLKVGIKRERARFALGMRRIFASVDSFINEKVEGRLLFLWIFSIFFFFSGKKRKNIALLAICLIFPSIVTLCYTIETQLKRVGMDRL